MPPMNKQSHWIAGINAVASAVEHDGENVREVLLEANAKNPRITEIETQARRLGIEVRRVAQNALDGVAGGLRHQGAVARYAAAKTWGEDELEGLVEAAAGKALVLVLDGVQDPHNLGACLRSAAAASVTAVVIPKDKAVQVNATVRKTSAGAADNIPVVRVTNLARCLRDLQQQGVWIYGLAGEAEASLYSIDLKGNVALVLGGEADGMRRLTREHCDQLVKIPMPGEIESLNVSVATGVALFEAVRQRCEFRLVRLRRLHRHADDPRGVRGAADGEDARGWGGVSVAQSVRRGVHPGVAAGVVQHLGVRARECVGVGECVWVVAVAELRGPRSRLVRSDPHFGSPCRSPHLFATLQNNAAVFSASYTAECASSPFQSMPAACTARASTVCP